jgi:hypothetical protein
MSHHRHPDWSADVLFPRGAYPPPGENPHLSGVDDASTCQRHALMMLQKSQNVWQHFQLSDAFVFLCHSLFCWSLLSCCDQVVSHETWCWHEK